MKYRDVEFTVVQGLGRQLWKWGVALEGKALTGQAATKAAAVAAPGNLNSSAPSATAEPRLSRDGPPSFKREAEEEWNCVSKHGPAVGGFLRAAGTVQAVAWWERPDRQR